MAGHTQTDFRELLQTVIGEGFCVGCGACASASDSPLKMHFGRNGQYTPVPVETGAAPGNETHLLALCPFSNHSANEDKLGSRLFGDGCEYDHRIGFYRGTYTGYVLEPPYRARGSSGGFGTWIAHELLSKKLVDGVIHVHPKERTPEDERIFHYQISRTSEQVLTGAKSRYYPVEMSEVMSIIRETHGNYLFVGLPCFVKAIRLLAQQDQVIANRIHYSLGLICGHLKSTHYGAMLAWQCGIPPSGLRHIDFRKKLPNRSANQYGIEVVGEKDNHTITTVRPVDELYGSDWGMGLFKLQACDYCDDVVAELADITVGDAWLPEYVHDSQGTNILIVRHPDIEDLLRQGVAEGRLHLDPCRPDTVYLSQAGGFRHRRDELAYRLHLAATEKPWVPLKRVIPSDVHIKPKRKAIQQVRIKLARESHEAFQRALEAGEFSVFEETLAPISAQYRKLMHLPRIKRAVLKLYGILRRLVFRFTH